ncbi:hypothetical protein JCM10908_001258 [Rhodotorula pacifica]|uniref:uncharacterized protein n=1 Tax=Rhodotorula pacifica TaxID=1495444 RepID=UPI003174D165
MWLREALERAAGDGFEVVRQPDLGDSFKHGPASPATVPSHPPKQTRLRKSGPAQRRGPKPVKEKPAQQQPRKRANRELKASFSSVGRTLNSLELPASFASSTVAHGTKGSRTQSSAGRAGRE